MKTTQETRHENEQEIINKKIENMLSVLEKRNKLIAEYYRSFLMPDEHFQGKDSKEQNDPVSP